MRPARVVLDAFILALGSFFAISGPYGLWAVLDWQVEVCHGCGSYDLPFAFPTTWNIAGDLFTTMTFAGFGLFVMAFADIMAQHEITNTPEVPLEAVLMSSRNGMAATSMAKTGRTENY
jgi:hypothetical protein